MNKHLSLELVREKFHLLIGSAMTFTPSSRQKMGNYNAGGKRIDINLKKLGKDLLALNLYNGEKNEIEKMLICTLALNSKEIVYLRQYFNNNEFYEQSFEEVRTIMKNIKSDIEALKTLSKRTGRAFPILGGAINKRIKIAENGMLSIQKSLME